LELLSNKLFPHDELSAISDSLRNIFTYWENTLSPLYTLWYELISFISGSTEPTLLYALTVFSFLILLISALKTLEVKWQWIALICLVMIHPKVLRSSHLMVIIISYGLAFKWDKKMIALILGFIRPEFLITLPLIFLTEEYKKKDYWYLIAFAILLIIIGVPGSDGRLELAIRSHYAFTYSLFNEFQDPWYGWRGLDFNVSMYMVFVAMYSMISIPSAVY